MLAGTFTSSLLYLLHTLGANILSLQCCQTIFAISLTTFKRERSRSPRRRSRSPRRRRSYSPRSRSRSRDEYRRSERRSRSPISGPVAGASGSAGYSSHNGHRPAAPPRSFEERAVAKEQMMQSVRDSSQQERRVYIGNLSYDVKWHHLKDFMRQGIYQ